jgi:Uma2 family endonuclease
MTAAPIPARLLTVDDVTRLAEGGDERRYELVDGNLITVPPANVRHQLITARLIVWLSNQGYADRVIPTPGVRTSDDNLNGRIPDLIVSTDPIADETVWVSPGLVALVVEILSKGSERTDRWFKPLEYARAGIPRFWRVEPDDLVVQFDLVADRYVEQARVPLTELLAGDAPAL